MITQHFYPACICTYLVLIFAAPHASASQQPDRATKIAEVVETEARFGLFSGQVLVADQGEVIYSGSFGPANMLTGTTNTSQTRFNLSSIQKAFIATTIMQLVQEGTLSLEDSLPKFYPNCPLMSAEQIRIRHLLNHTSGLGAYRESEEYREHVDSYQTIDDVLPLVFKSKLRFEPGERHYYSNAGVLLLKGIIERTIGQKLADCLDARIFKPSGMIHTEFYIDGDSLQDIATGHRATYEGDDWEVVEGGPAAYAGGGIYSTAEDLLRFDRALNSDLLLDNELKQVMFTPVETSPNYAYGWEVSQPSGTTIVYHSGWSGGFNSEFRRYSETGLTVIVLANFEGAAYVLANKLGRLLQDKPYQIADRHDKFLRNGEVSMWMGDSRRSIAQLRKFTALVDDTPHPDLAKAYRYLGRAYQRMGNRNMAIHALEDCLRVDPDYEGAGKVLWSLKMERVFASPWGIAGIILLLVHLIVSLMIILALRSRGEKVGLINLRSGVVRNFARLEGTLQTGSSRSRLLSRIWVTSIDLAILCLLATLLTI